MTARTGLHPATLASIEMQGPSVHLPFSAWKCGCERRSGGEATHGKWWLCGYHEGFEDGIAAMAEHQPKEVREMMIEDDLVARLRERDSSVYMNGDENWVLTVHPDDPTRPGTLMVNLPWQACRLLREAADEIERLRDAIHAHRDAVQCCDAEAQTEDRSTVDRILWAEAER